MRIGIDVGGTNTDAVLMDGTEVLSSVKTATTPDVTAGIVTALRSSSGIGRRRAARRPGGDDRHDALHERGRRGQAPDADRRGSPWPARDGGAAADGRLAGASQADPRRTTCTCATAATSSTAARSRRSTATRSARRRPTSVPKDYARSRSPPSSRRSTRSWRTKRRGSSRRSCPGVAVTLSHEIGRIGLLERENAAIINACLRDLALRDRRRLPRRARRARHRGAALPHPERRHADERRLRRALPGADVRLGTDELDARRRLPLRRAGRAVVDIGGTTSDVGVLQHGFPREASVAVDIGGVRTNFRMPDVFSFGLGGGSIVRSDPELTIGPDSVGYELTSARSIFGGDTLTTSDVASRPGRADFGDASLVASSRQRPRRPALARIESDDRRGGRPHEDDRRADSGRRRRRRQRCSCATSLPGASRMVKPEHFDAANAVGAAIAQIGGEVDRVFSLDGLTREDALDAGEGGGDREGGRRGRRREQGPDRRRRGGAARLPARRTPTRIRVKAVGDLEL